MSTQDRDFGFSYAHSRHLFSRLANDAGGHITRKLESLLYSKKGGSLGVGVFERRIKFQVGRFALY
jgi:hypothetical protein